MYKFGSNSFYSIVGETVILFYGFNFLGSLLFSPINP